MDARLKRRITKGLVLTVSVIGLALIAASAHRTVPPTAVVIVTLDTTRADRLSPYGFMDVVMPGLERLAREGVLFDQAMTASPLTLPAHSSLFTGLLPPNHGVRDNADPPLAASMTTMAEILAARGYRTAAFVGATVLDADRGLSQGFDVYQAPSAAPGARANRRERRADEVMTGAVDWLAGVGRSPFLLWAHLYDPHRPYNPPDPFRSRHPDPYIGEIAFADAQIARLLTAIDDLHLGDRTVVIVAADHGESLGEHGEDDHGIFVYQSVLRVPLIVRAPGVTPRRIRSVVRLVDVLPTVLDLLDVSRPSGPGGPRGDGVSLRGMMVGREPLVDLEAYAESMYPRRFGCSPVRALHDGRYKFVDAPRRELYDLATDPFEERNVYAERRPLSDALGRRLHSYDATTPHIAPQASEPPEPLRQRLAALGYVGTGGTRPSSSQEPLPDPKDCAMALQSGASQAVLDDRDDDVAASRVLRRHGRVPGDGDPVRRGPDGRSHHRRD